MERLVGSARVRAPRWSEWQRALSVGGSGPAQMLRALVGACVQGMEPSAVDLLSAAEGDALLEAIFALMESQRAELDLSVAPVAGGIQVTGRGVDLLLRPWSFGERNAALDLALIAEGDGVRLDLPAFELAMVLGCVTASGRRLSPADVAGWPVALGEAVVAALDELNGVAPGRSEILAACVRQGVRHPDLDLVELCLAFGWMPEQVEGLTARQAERLLGALGARREASGGAGNWAGASGEPGGSGHWAGTSAPAGPGHTAGEVTRIVVTDR